LDFFDSQIEHKQKQTVNIPLTKKMKKQTQNLLSISALVLCCMVMPINAKAQCQWFQNTSTSCASPDSPVTASPGDPPSGNNCEAITYSPSFVQECISTSGSGVATCCLVPENLTMTVTYETDFGSTCGLPQHTKTYNAGTCNQAALSGSCPKS
jgi:hypothetical protein